jgi:hypothetical protein
MVGETPETPVAVGLDPDGFPVDKDNKRLPGATAIPKEKQQQFLDGLKKAPVPFNVSSGSEVFQPGPGSGADVTDPNVGKLERFNLWETLKKRNQIPDESKVTSFARNLLSDLSCVENKTSGVLTVFNNGAANPMFDISRTGIVGLRKNWNLDDAASLASTDHIDALLKGAAAAKMTSGAAGANIASPNPNSQAMMEKAAQLAGLKIANPKFLKYNADGTVDSTALDAQLEKIEKGLAEKMNKQAEDMKSKYGVEEFRAAPVVQPQGMIPNTVPPKTATELTDANAATEATKPGIPTVLLVYDPKNPGSSLKELDRLAAMGGDKVNVVKMDINLLTNGDPNNPPTLGLSVKEPGENGKSFTSPTVPATAEDMKKWIEGTEALNTKVFPEAAPSTPATAKLTAEQVGKNAEARAATAFTGLNIKDQTAVTGKLEEWAQKWGERAGATAADKTAVNTYLAKLQQDPALDAKGLAQASNDFLTTLSKADGFKAPAKGDPGADMLENISLASQAFASANGVTGGDAKLYRTFQPSDPTKPEQLPDAATQTAAVVKPVTAQALTA